MAADARIRAQEVFLQILGPLLAHALFAFRHIRNEHDREDFIQEAVCVAWKWTARLLEQDKDPREFPTGLAQNATRHVKVGRTFVGGSTGTKDPLCRRARARHGFSLHSLADRLPDHERLRGRGERHLDAIEQYLAGHDGSPVPDQAAFRIDFRAWRLGHDERRREILDAMITGERTLDLARAFRVSPARISQLRREFLRAWRAFCGD